tara:strand:+ start:1557 stop:1727 length:171 start_codon:yes stop_codon:yes gene_type:complete
LNKDYTKIINEYYLLALLEVNDGMTRQELKESIEMYKQDENYEACAGLTKALNNIK